MSDKKMKPEVKAKWLEALRSGEFEKTTGTLCRDGEGYCCLGVLSELAYREGVTDKEEAGGGEWKYGKKRGDQSESFLPKSVQRWAGLDDAVPEVFAQHPTWPEDEDSRWSLAELNDEGRTFPEIADLIEAQL